MLYAIISEDREGSLADRLQARKISALGALSPAVVASGNVGCITQLAAVAPWPVVHTVELLDWATGGPSPVPSREGER